MTVTLNHICVHCKWTGLGKALLCLKKKLWLITVTIIVEGDIVLYDLLECAEGQLGIVLWNMYVVLLDVLNGVLQGEFSVMYNWLQAEVYCHVVYEAKHEGWNFNSGNYLFTTDTK